MKTAIETILLNLNQGEVCKSMIDRLYGRSNHGSNGIPEKKKIIPFKRNIRKSELEKQELKSEFSDSCSKVNKELADKLVESCNWLLEADILNIYSMKKEDIEPILPRASEIAKKINRGREAEDLLPDLQQDEMDEEEESLRKRFPSRSLRSGLVQFDDDDDADSDENNPSHRPRKMRITEAQTDKGAKTFNSTPKDPNMMVFVRPPRRLVTKAEAAEDEEAIPEFVKSVEKPLPKVEVRPLSAQAVDAMKLLGSSKLEQELQSAIQKSKPRNEVEEDDDNIF